MTDIDKYIKPLADRIGDYLYDPEPVHEPVLEAAVRGELEYLYSILMNIHDIRRKQKGE